MSIQPVYSIQVVFEGKEVGHLKDVVSTKLTYRKLRRLVDNLMDELEDDMLPEVFRMKLNNGNIIDKSKEKDILVELKTEDNILELINVVDTPNVFDGKSYKMGGVSIKETTRKSSLFQDNINSIKDYKTLPFPLVFDIIRHSIICFLGGLFPYLLFNYILIQTDYLWYKEKKGIFVSFHNDQQSAIAVILIQIPSVFFSVFNFFFTSCILTEMYLIKNYWSIGYFFIYILMMSSYIYHGVINFQKTSWEEHYEDNIVNIIYVLHGFYTLVYIFNSSYKYKMQLLKWYLVLGTFEIASNFLFPQIFSDIKNDIEKSIVLFVSFLIKEVMLTIIRLISRPVGIKNIVLLKFFLLFFCLFTRFLFGSMDTVKGFTMTLVLSGFVEILSRQTHGFKDRLLYQIIGKYEMKENKEFRARYIFLEMECEFLAIIATPITMFVFYDKRLFYNMSYGAYDDPLDGWFLLYVLVSSFFMEIIVDVLCLKVEMDLHQFSVEEQWNNKYKEYTFIIMFISIAAFNTFNSTFNYGLITPSCFCNCTDQLIYDMQIEYCENWVNITG